MELTPYAPSEYSLVRADAPPDRLPPIRSGDQPSKSDYAPAYTIQNTRYVLPSGPMTHGVSHQPINEIESWPTSGSSAACKSLALNHHGRLVSTGSSLKGKLDTTPKPRFLAILEDYLYSELKALGVEHTTGTDARLQVFREVFATVIDDFKTYKPLLAAIKNEYEIMLTHYKDRVKELEPLRQQLVLLSEECDRKLMKYRDEEREDVFLLKEEKKNLQQAIRQLNNQNQNLEATIVRLQEEVADQYELYRKELDARKLLINDNNDLRSQQEKRIGEKEGTDDQGIRKEDPIMMKIALRQARKDLNLALEKITYMEANYNDVVPRRDFVALESKSNEFLERIRELQTAHEQQIREIVQLRSQTETLKEDYQRVQRERDELSQKNESVHDEMTPRPSWDLAGEVVDGGAERWQHISANRASNEKLIVLLNEFTGGGNDEDAGDTPAQINLMPDQLPARGEGDQVPFHLRSSKSMKNRRLTRRDVAVLIQEIWTERRLSDRQNGRTKTLSEFIYEYFRNRHGNHTMAVEMCYNLDYACKRFTYNENFQLFHRILSGETDEDVYHYSKNLIEQLAERVIKESNGKPHGSVTNEQFNDMLKRNLPHKSSKDIEELIHAAYKEQPNEEQIALAKLFSVDDEDNYGEFIRVLKRQLNEDKQSCIHDIQQKLDHASSVNAKDLERLIREIDPHVQTHDLARIVQWTFENKDGRQIPSMSVPDALQRLHNGVLYRQNILS